MPTGSITYTFDVPFLSPRAARLLDRLRDNDWFRNLGRQTKILVTGEGVSYRFVGSRREAVRRLQSVPWDRQLTAAGNAVLTAYQRLFGTQWYHRHGTAHTTRYGKAVRPVHQAAARRLAEAVPELAGGRDPEILLSNMTRWVAAADLYALDRIEFLLTEAAIYLAGHIPCGWTGRELHRGEFLVY